ncbi:hypothetical protein ABBQ38_014972 [Trebouxia sp. C0009 RCD-2024]
MHPTDSETCMHSPSASVNGGNMSHVQALHKLMSTNFPMPHQKVRRYQQLLVRAEVLSRSFQLPLQVVALLTISAFDKHAVVIMLLSCGIKLILQTVTMLILLLLAFADVQCYCG